MHGAKLLEVLSFKVGQLEVVLLVSLVETTMLAALLKVFRGDASPLRVEP